VRFRPADALPAPAPSTRPGFRCFGFGPADYIAATTDTIAGRDVLDKATPVVVALAQEHIGSRLRDTDLSTLTDALRTISGASQSEVRQP
jgi:hypothetical protein